MLQSNHLGRDRGDRMQARAAVPLGCGQYPTSELVRVGKPLRPDRAGDRDRHRECGIGARTAGLVLICDYHVFVGKTSL
jgi:hypothetical protein